MTTDKTPPGLTKKARGHEAPHAHAGTEPGLEMSLNENGLGQWMASLDEQWVETVNHSIALISKVDINWTDQSSDNYLSAVDVFLLLRSGRLLSEKIEELGASKHEDLAAIFPKPISAITNVIFEDIFDVCERRSINRKALKKIRESIKKLKVFAPMQMPRAVIDDKEARIIIGGLLVIDEDVYELSVLFSDNKAAHHTKNDTALLKELLATRNKYKECARQFLDDCIVYENVDTAYRKNHSMIDGYYEEYKDIRHKLSHISSQKDFSNIVRPDVLNPDFKGIHEKTRKKINAFFKYEITPSIGDAATVGEAFEFLSLALSDLGVEQFLYGMCVESTSEQKMVWGYWGNYHPEFLGNYIRNNWLNHDPTLKNFLRSKDMSPVLWNYPEDTERNGNLTKDERMLEELSWKYGLKNGATVPISLNHSNDGPLAAAGVCAPASLERSEWNKLWEANREQIIELLHQFHDRITSIPNFTDELEMQEDYRLLFKKMLDGVKSDSSPNKVNETLETIISDLDETPADQRWARFRELFGKTRAHLRETIGEEQKEINGAELYKDRPLYAEQSELNAPDFFTITYPEYATTPVYAIQLGQHDPKLLVALRNWCNRKEDRNIEKYIKPIEEFTDASVGEFESELDEDRDAGEVLKEQAKMLERKRRRDARMKKSSINSVG